MIMHETGYLTKENGIWKYFYYLKDHVGSNRLVLDDQGGVVQINNFYPYGLTQAEPTPRTDQAEQPYKFGGKELDRDFGVDAYDFEARMYNPAIGRFMQPDPLAEKYYSISPYAFCLNNPIRYIDPDGRDVYRFDDKTGEMILYQQTDDNFDQIGRFKYNKKTDTYTLKTNKNGEARTRIDNIEKGILSDGMNFKTNNNSWSVGGEGQPTVAGFQDFAISFAEMINKEVSGYYLSNPQTSDVVSTIYIGRYEKNTATESYKGNLWGHLPGMQFTVQVHTDWHTHPTYGYSETARITASPQDYASKKNALGAPHPYNRPSNFIILTRGYAPIFY